MKKLVYGIGILFFIAGCSKPEQYDIVPAITFKSFNKESFNVSEQMVITVEFTDGDGDIGMPADNPIDTVQNLCLDSGEVYTTNLIYNATKLNRIKTACYYQEVKDTCVNFMNTEYVPNEGKYKSIKGEIDLLLTADSYKQCAVSPCIDTQYYLIRIRDRAGNLSNVIKTPPIYVTSY